jgi:diguanylate cyclase (GGDEF)-like protein
VTASADSLPAFVGPPAEAFATAEVPMLTDAHKMLVNGGPEPALIVQEGPSIGTCFRFAPNMRRGVVGRLSNLEFPLQHASVSRKHAQLELLEGRPPKLVVQDLGSRNGTRVNGHRISGGTALELDDILGIGSFLLRFRLLDPLDRRFAGRLEDVLAASRRDPLTGLLNRSYLEQRLAEAAKAHANAGLPMGLLMVDVDRFKRINDTLGHPVGDRVLVAVAQAVRRAVRDTDPVVRYGGEEILVALPTADATITARVGERIRRGVEELTFVPVAPGLRVTTSVGWSTLDRDGELDALVARADAALYRAKTTGRNRVIGA